MKQILNSCPLFSGIAAEQLERLLDCLSAAARVYHRDEFIFRAEEPARFVGIVLSGSVNIAQEDYWGNRNILGRAAPGELFGEAFSCAGAEHLPVSVIAAEDAEILRIDCRKIITACAAACDFHTQLIANMLQILAEKNIMLTRKMEYISKRTLREKLIAYLSAQAAQAGRSSVRIPFNRQELADYLCAERSALSRELGAMKKDGLLDYRKNHFTLQSPAAQ